MRILMNTPQWPQCLQSIHHNTIHHNSSQYYVKSTCAPKKLQKGWHGLKMPDMICSAKHSDPLQAAPLMKQNFLLPHCQWHLHQQHWRRHLPQNSAVTVPRWKCDMWPKTCSTGVLISPSRVMASLLHQHEWTRMPRKKEARSTNV